MPWTLMADPIRAALASACAWLTAGAHAVAPVAVAALWQGAAIAIALGICLHLAPRIHIHIAAAQRFAVWTAAFASVALLPLLPSLTRAAASSSAANAARGLSSPAPWFQLDGRWALAIVVLWLMLSLVRAANLAAHVLRLRRLWSSATPVAAEANLRPLLSTASPRRPVELCTTRRLDRPSVIGFFAPRILIPDWLFSRLTPGELEHIVLHEAEHLRRRDDWTNLLQKLALVLFPLNPALVWIERRLCREREMACDEGVVRRTQAPRAYAACLASLAERGLERRRAHALSLGAFERRPELVRRVSSLLARKPALNPIAARALVGVAACGLFVASVVLARCPRMVVFIPGAPAAAPSSLLAQTDLAPRDEGDRVFAEPAVASGISGFRAVQARAILPAGSNFPQPAPSSAHRAVPAKMRSAGASEREVASAAVPSRAPFETQPFAFFVKGWDTSTHHSPSSRQLAAKAPREQMWHRYFAVSSQPQFVVLTAWQEIDTAPRRANSAADYDTAVSAQPGSSDSEGASANSASGQPSIQIAVTRLIVWIAPRPSAATFIVPAPGSGLPRSTASNSRRPPAPIPANAWLVFEL